MPKVHAETAVEAERRFEVDARRRDRGADRHAARRSSRRPCAPASRRRAARCRSTRSGSTSDSRPRPRAISVWAATLYDQKLAFALFSPLSRQEIRARAESELAATRAAMYDIAPPILKERRGSPPTPDKPSAAQQQRAIKAALELAYAERPEARRGARRRARLAGRCHAVRAREEHRDGARRAARDHRRCRSSSRAWRWRTAIRPVRSRRDRRLSTRSRRSRRSGRARRRTPSCANTTRARSTTSRSTRPCRGTICSSRMPTNIRRRCARCWRPARSSKAGRCTPSA